MVGFPKFGHIYNRLINGINYLDSYILHSENMVHIRPALYSFPYKIHLRISTERYRICMQLLRGDLGGDINGTADRTYRSRADMEASTWKATRNSLEQKRRAPHEWPLKNGVVVLWPTNKDTTEWPWQIVRTNIQPSTSGRPVVSNNEQECQAVNGKSRICTKSSRLHLCLHVCAWQLGHQWVPSARVQLHHG